LIIVPINMLKRRHSSCDIWCPNDSRDSTEEPCQFAKKKRVSNCLLPHEPENLSPNPIQVSSFHNDI